MNPVAPSTSGENSLIMTEYMGWCEDSGTIYNDWIEVFNSESAVEICRAGELIRQLTDTMQRT